MIWAKRKARSHGIRRHDIIALCYMLPFVNTVQVQL